MMKAVAANADGDPLIVLGLTHRNLEALKENNPIHIHMSELGLKGEIYIFAAKDERTMEEMFEGKFEVDTKIGSTCPKCRAGLREDSSCDCKETMT